MGRFILRRVVQAVLVILAATLLIFLATFAIGDPFASSGEKAVPPDIAAANRAKFGLDKPLPLQYVIYLGNMVRGDFGIDFEQHRPVAQMLEAAIPNTVRLALVAIVIDILIGVVAGVIAAVKRYSFWDVLVTVIATLAIGIPVFVIGVVLVANVAGWGPFPSVPRSFTVQVPWYQEVLLPAFTLAIIDAAFIARLMRGSMLEVLRADYIRTARAKGLSERTVIGKHAMRNSLIPVVTYVGVSLGVLFGGAIITETIFQYNGVGYLLSTAIVKSNAPVIIAVVIFSVVAYVVLSTIVDILYAFLDPRIRLN
ncbi:ABC transporter permease [Pseudonocardia dioxanivorans]|jgi:ABC-type dipeptide/oligopeptide/nickel transport system permease component|uniref:ABC-type transporter, integral membrane subunit n=2 Tax=Pseudonocardiaceae TaxID=2070 RepID=F4CKP6_PSEUX|nr:ABC transporter permease [Pseudonocardia dioxanivorans]AEA23253.1 ABC-type transporter, integral membrane subunit [Pseudonocardia dioxanivorans CB1190]GJF03452.1 glutathione ABC transporter permease [Pseudonocardia sp. D17]